MVGRVLSFWEGLFLAAMLVLGRVITYSFLRSFKLLVSAAQCLGIHMSQWKGKVCIQNPTSPLFICNEGLKLLILEMVIPPLLSNMGILRMGIYIYYILACPASQ